MKRGGIEAVNDILMTVCNIDQTRHRNLLAEEQLATATGKAAAGISLKLEYSARLPLQVVVLKILLAERPEFAEKRHKLFWL
uniref:transposase n=1 Tax=Pontibacter diazotrophicus TaxID=1400979 RepID=UPI001C69B0D9|nr:transposase [Pontibacter diazotrophicus]